MSAAYSQTLAATGGTPPYVNWTVITGSLPAGLSLNPATGAITGTPTTTATSNFTVQVQDSAGTPQTASKAFALTVNPATLIISTASPLPSGALSAYSQPLAATGGTPPYTNWTVTAGSLPTGLSLNSSTGAITGTPASPGIFNFSVQVTDSATPSAQTVTKAFSLTIAPGTLSISIVSPLNTAIANSPYSNTLIGNRRHGSAHLVDHNGLLTYGPDVESIHRRDQRHSDSSGFHHIHGSCAGFE